MRDKNTSSPAAGTQAEIKFDYANISPAGQSWIEDLQRAAPESHFPDIDPGDMTEEDRDTLSAYLRADDGSLGERDMQFSKRVAAEIDSIAGEEAE